MMNRLIEHLQFQIMQNEDIIEELGLADTDSLIEKEDIDYLKDENKYYEKVINELKDLQALKEELGISLPILFKAFKQGVQGYKSIESLYYDEINKKWYIECIYKYGDYGTHYTETLALKDYGKTWWLEEDLKSE